MAAQLGCRTISLDDYFLDPTMFPIVHDRPDYDRMEAVDWERAIEDIRTIADSDETIVIEGFLLLAHAELRELLDVSLFVELDEAERVRRRFAREAKTECLYIAEHIPRRHRELVEPSKMYADVVVDGNRPTEQLLDEVIELCLPPVASRAILEPQLVTA